MGNVNIEQWQETKNSQLQTKKEFVQDLIKEREDIHKKQLEQLLKEEITLDNKLLRIKGRHFCFSGDASRANAIHNALLRIADQRRQWELQFFREKMQLQLMLQEVTLEEKTKRYLSQWK